VLIIDNLIAVIFWAILCHREVLHTDIDTLFYLCQWVLHQKSKSNDDT